MLLHAFAHPILTRSVTELNATLAAMDVATASVAQCDTLLKCRSLNDILWTCASVIFICTWVAVHPDVPHPDDHTMVVWLKYAMVTVYALIGPELIMVWSLRQKLSADKVYAKYKKYGWSKAHAYLLIIGGFSLYDGDECVGILRDREKMEDEPQKFKDVLSEMQLEEHIDSWLPPNGKPAWEEKAGGINVFNQSYGLSEDPTSYMIPVLHVQENDPTDVVDFNTKKATCLLELLLAKGFIEITEDEVMARGKGDALAKVIVIFQVGWFILQCIARKVEGHGFADIEVITLAHAAILVVPYYYWWNKPLRVRNPVRVMWRRREYPPKEDTKGDPSLLQQARTFLREGPRKVMEYLVYDVRNNLKHYHDFSGSSKQLQVPTYLGWKPTVFFFFFIGTLREALLPNCRPRSLFYNGTSKIMPVKGYAVYIAGFLFAAVHFFPWDSAFPTGFERDVWRAAAIALISVPILMAPFHYFSIQGRMEGFKEGQGKKDRYLKQERYCNKVIFFLSGLYCLARLATVVIAFTTLRALPVDVRQAVEWTQLIPHIG
ncbi:hypothetical protein Moror_10966 [Moniliophthora roreri MCA 2997]|uniref:Uncharacterized protein n=2 Tax=Moniliophthora roreri TaxID=221103 RepID=V2WXA3_MONRO|nr:hypothetical protein Moror_10966 [Moniliophthora roreri MCA 2997]KAI3609569.1 hypothetical protein WG66_001334 [Moniliophthora roreri]